MSAKIPSCFLLISFLFVSVFYAQEKQVKQSFFFDHDSYELTTKHKQIIDSLNVVFIKDSIKIDIKGYASNLGTKTYNLELSNKRAFSVKRAFVNFINTTAIGYGELENSLSKSRRVDVLISVFEKNKEIENLPKVSIDKEILNNKEEIKVGDVFRLNGILFKGGTDVFLNSSYLELKKLLDFMKKNNYEIELLGHICCTTDGSEGVNNRTRTRSLSIDRAKAVFDYLLDNGIEENRMSFYGMAGSFPTGKDVKYDRRVEVEIISID